MGVPMYNHRRGMVVRGRAVSKLWIPSPLSRSTFDFVMKKSPQSEGTFIALEIKAPGRRCHPGALVADVNLTDPHGRCGDCTAVIVGTDPSKNGYFGIVILARRKVILKIAEIIIIIRSNQSVCSGSGNRGYIIAVFCIKVNRLDTHRSRNFT